MDIVKEVERIEQHFKEISSEELEEKLIECGVNEIKHTSEWKD